MPKVNGEVVKQPLHVRPLPIPRRQAVDREGVTQVVQPRLVAGAVRAPHAGMFPEPLEGILQCRIDESRPRVCRGRSGSRRRPTDESPPASGHTRVNTAVRCRPIGTSRDLKNLVSRMVSRAFGKSTSATDRFSASPRRNPAPYSSNRIARRVCGSIRVR